MGAAAAAVAGAVAGGLARPASAARVAALAVAAAAAAMSVLVATRRAAGPARADRWRSAVLVVALVASLAGGAAWRSATEWRAVGGAAMGPWEGWASVAADPAPRGAATAVVLRLDGWRYEAWAYGRHRARADSLEAGDRVWIEGIRTVIGDAQARRRAAVRHVAGRLRLEVIADVRPGPPAAVAANRIRRLLREAAERSMDGRHAALFTGLVIGDDARQDESMVAQFREAGLSHLTAVSGQNVAFVLLAAAPLLRRLPPWPRWLATLAVIGGFAVVARAEPSVLRAGVMAALAATAFTVGRPVHPLRLLALAVAGLVLVDPFLVESVGFWLSVGATAGVCALAPSIERRCPGPRWVAMPLSLTVAAQAGVAVPALVVFGRLPAVALVANPPAGAVAGLVMLAGLPSAAVSALLSQAGAASAAAVAMWPVAVGTRWVAEVARVAAAVSPPAAVSLAAWLVLAAWLALRRPRTPVPI